MISLIEPVLTKKQNFRLWQDGVFGNRLRTWRNPTEWFLLSNGHVPVAIRTLLGGNGPFPFNLRSSVDVQNAWSELRRQGIAEASMLVCEQAPDDDILIQGEYRHLDDGYALDGRTYWGSFHHSYALMPMRPALHAGSGVYTSYGLQSHLLLRSRMNQGSWEDFQSLVSGYPTHVIEVSVYGCCLGNIPGRNTIVWEVRRY